jgi:glycosyltransferase involved in cell wall biosynthesis
VVVKSVTTIVTCMTDAERPFLAEALRSVRDQTVCTNVILCVTDQNEWVDEVLSALRPGIEVMRLPLASPGSVRNQAISAVQTDLVAFLDSDDLWKPPKLRKQIDSLTARGLDVVGAKHILIREDGTPFFFGFAKNIPMTSSWLGRTATYRERPFEDLQVGEDVLLWETLDSEGRCGIMDDFLIRYRVREVSISAATSTKQRKLAYARRSQIPGVRPLLLGASYAANVGFRMRRRVRAIHMLSDFGTANLSDHPAEDWTVSRFSADQPMPQ